MMKQLSSLMMLTVLAVLVFMVSGCGTVIPPGEVGIKVNRLGDDRGVSALTLSTGWVTYFPGWSVVFAYPTYMQTAVWSSSGEGRKDRNDEIVFNTKDGMVIKADVSLSYQLEAAKIPAFYVKFRTDDLDVFTHGFLFNVARDAFNEIASTYTLEEIYGAKKEEYLNKVRAKVNDQIKEYGVMIQQMGFLGKLRIPELVEAAINGKMQAIQDAIKVENQVRQAEAEAKKKIAAAEGTAKSNALIANSMTAQLIQWEQLQIQKNQIEKWNGAYPSTMVGGGTPFMFNMPVPGK
jgi:regulator of protease activity HflC (stomatin/prohibitin superfamily)